VAADGGKEKDIPLAQVLDVRFPNAMGLVAKCAFYVSHAWEFVSGEPREANTEGGVFPAIFGTVLMVIESMKLETQIRASQDGIVERLHVKDGDSFDRDAILVTLSQGN